MDNECRTGRRKRGFLFPLILIVVGIVLLLEKNGIIARQLVSQWWPLLLVGMGSWMLVTRCNRNEP